MRKLLLMLLRAVRAQSLAQRQQASVNGFWGDDQIRLLEHREVNLYFFMHNDIKQLNAVMERDTNISFTKTDDNDERGEDGNSERTV